MPRALHGAVAVVGFERAEVEKEHDHAAVAQVFMRQRFQWSRRHGLAALQFGLCRRGSIFRNRNKAGHVLHVERLHALRFAIFQHGEVRFLQPAHQVAAFVAHGHADQHQIAIHTECEAGLTLADRRLHGAGLSVAALLRGRHGSHERHAQQKRAGPLQHSSGARCMVDLHSRSLLSA